MNRKLFTVMLAIVLLLSAASLMAACGGGEEDEMAKTVVGGRDSDIGIQMSPAGPSTSERAVPASPRVSASVSPSDGTLLPRDTSPPSVTVSPPSITVSPPSVTVSPPSVTVSPHDPVKTVRHHVTGGTKCWCGAIHPNTASLDAHPTHTEYDCFCESYYGSVNNYSHPLHHTISRGVYYYISCWCGLRHEDNGYPSNDDWAPIEDNGDPFGGSHPPQECWCWQLDTLADTATKVVRHHIVGYDPAHTCWCGEIHEPPHYEEHADLDCWCLSIYGSDYTPGPDIPSHHIVNSTNFEGITEICWCGGRHYEQGFEHSHFTPYQYDYDVDCSCWKFDTAGRKVLIFLD